MRSIRIVIWRPEPENKLEMIASKVIECFRKDSKISVRRLAEGFDAENKDIKKPFKCYGTLGFLCAKVQKGMAHGELLNCKRR